MQKMCIDSNKVKIQKTQTLRWSLRLPSRFCSSHKPDHKYLKWAELGRAEVKRKWSMVTRCPLTFSLNESQSYKYTPEFTSCHRPHGLRWQERLWNTLKPLGSSEEGFSLVMDNCWWSLWLGFLEKLSLQCSIWHHQVVRQCGGFKVWKGQHEVIFLAMRFTFATSMIVTVLSRVYCKSAKHLFRIAKKSYYRIKQYQYEQTF